jgi:hypothetical protein
MGVRRPAGRRGYATTSLHTLRMESDTYRRRRVLALLAGLGLIGLLAWAFTGGGGKPATPSAGSASTYHLLPAAASRSAPGAHHASGTPASDPEGSGLPSPSATPAASASGSASAGLEGGPLTADGRCDPGTVILSVFSTRSRYPGGQDPTFAVYAVSIAALPCTFDLGPGRLRLEVMSSGRVIWDSGDCARSDNTWTARLRRGVPVLESITWDRTVTLPGCVTLASSVRAGTYQARAATASTSSAVLTFRLVH